MKKVFSILMVALFATAAVSCSKDTEDLIIGSWNEEEVIYSYVLNGVAQEPMSMLEPGETATITFNEDRTYNSIYHSTVGDAEDSGTWSYADNKLTIISDGSPMVYDIDHIDKNNMTLIYNEEGEEDGDTYSVTISMKMKRI